MPFHQRKFLKNHFIIGFVPFGATFSEFIQPFLRDVKKLEKACKYSLGVVTADLPQGNDLCGVKRHGANHGCRNCFVPRESLSDNNYDHLQNTRYLQQIKNLRQKYNLLKNMQEKKEFATKYGLSIEPSLLSSLQWNPFIQIPQDPYHAISGKIARLLDSTLEILSQNGKKNLNKFWKYFEFPSHWSRMQNPISHSKSFYMSDCQRLAMIFPFILQRFLTPEYIKKEVFEKMKIATSLNSNNLIKKIIECWIRIANCTKLVFSSYFRNKDDYNNLDIMLREESECLIKVFPEFNMLPNVHVNFHLVQHAVSYGNLINISVGVKEMVHRTFKIFAPHTNKKEIDFDLIKRYNTMEGIRKFFDNNVNYKKIEIFDNWFITNNSTNISEDPYHAISGKIARLLDSTLEILSQNGKKNLNKFWKYFEFPSHWSRMQNPISHSKSFYMSNCQRLAMIFPFILQRFLTPEYIKKEVFEKMKIATSLNSNNLIKKIIECWIRIANCTKLVFSSYFRNKDDYNNLDIMLREESECLIKVFPEFNMLPNVHVNFHLVQYAVSYGNLINISVGVKEMKIEIFDNWFITNNSTNISEDITSSFEYIQNIKLSRKLKKKEFESFDLEDIQTQLHVAYQMKNENRTINRIKIKSGDAIEIEEFEHGSTYAIVKSIISHKGNDNNEYQFFYITWYNQISNENN
ncbi:hypothetical protein Glove_284g147 [Diversispora epigaea]|uniref:Uncharacterized protein n=1 Tax=Diversispora epigaea TaxID=1348612 RepID=A0A397I2W7_9GLOM|nr:hypothetical protein Glove_284g147 [Diversispora epigaea]